MKFVSILILFTSLTFAVYGAKTDGGSGGGGIPDGTNRQIFPIPGH